jgi:hypothetical protein
MTEEAPKTVTVTLELSERVAGLLTVLTRGEYAPEDLQGVVMTLIDHAQQGVYRPGAWERSWLEQVFGYEWQAALEPDTERTAADGRVVFDRPMKPCPNDPPCQHGANDHETDAIVTYCLYCDCGRDDDEPDSGDA